ncbi:TPA: LPD25 domain-containing protein [Photobacterium damselae]|uniref:LPD25 domain-containing protein n=1 Tax=Photobacterium damselae TaxID=38293 RepID=UPI0035E3FDC3
MPKTPQTHLRKIKPKTVFVHWSESREFSDLTLYDFNEFEQKALKVAKLNPLGGYDKTKVTVTFDNEHQHECRLDLGCNGNDHGFAQHCLSIAAYFNQHKGDADKPWLYDKDHQQLIALINTYEFDLTLIEQGCLQIKHIEEQARAEEAAQQQRKKEALEQAWREHQNAEALFQQSLDIPQWAQGVIVATLTDYDAERSEPYSGEFHTKTLKTIILAWSKHSRNLFPELRKACLNHPETAFLNEPEKSVEHRERFTMGDGYYLTDTKYIRYGWQVKKRYFYNVENKSRYVPMGELAVPQQ